MIGYFLFGTNIRESESSAGSLNHIRAHYLAQSGIDWALNYSRNNTIVDTTIAFAEGNFNVSMSDDGKIRSRGYVGSYEKELSINVTFGDNAFFPEMSIVANMDTSVSVSLDTVLIQEPSCVITHIVENNDNSFISSPFATVGNQNVNTGESRILLQFNLDVLPVDSESQIDTAFLYLHKLPTHHQKVHELSVHAIESFWMSFDHIPEINVSWSYRKDGISWTTPGGDFGPALDSTIMTSGGNQMWEVTQSVRDMLDILTGDNFGWLIKDVAPEIGTWSKFARPITPKLLIIYQGQPTLFIIGDQQILNGDLYTGMGAFVMDSSNVGQPPLDSTHIYVPLDKTVDRYPVNQWSVIDTIPEKKIYYPKMTEIVDSLNGIANAITGFAGNRYLTWAASPVVDLSTYEDNTVFVKNFIYFSGVEVLDMPKSEPGFIVTAGYVSANNTIFGDNVVIISNGNITLNTTMAGSPFEPPNSQIVNMFWSAHGDIDIQSNCILYANLVAYNDNSAINGVGNVTLSSSVYGGIFVGNTLDFVSSACYLKGKFWTEYVSDNVMNAGQIILGQEIPNVFAGAARSIFIQSNLTD